jgi:2-(1,2-epoxy-1,2-dihydrophenyl)acetyl-CoA isomerase
MEVSRILHQMPKPVVAQVDGAAAAPGFRSRWPAISASPALLQDHHRLRQGRFSGDYGGTYFLTQLLGSAKARELYLMSPVLTAQEALHSAW